MGKRSGFWPQKRGKEKLLLLEVRVDMVDIPPFGCVAPDHCGGGLKAWR